MERFTYLQGIVAPLDRGNVDTDAIIPKQFLKSISRQGFGPYLFDEWRYTDPGELGMDCEKRPKQTDFPLNQPRYQGASILLTRDNFGCGSSREHAPSFADIFYNNCFKNGMLPIVLDGPQVEALFQAVYDQAGYQLEIDLPKQVVTTPQGEALSFELENYYKQRLLQGLDEIALTLQHATDIRAYEVTRRETAPWLFDE